MLGLGGLAEALLLTENAVGAESSLVATVELGALLRGIAAGGGGAVAVLSVTEVGEQLGGEDEVAELEAVVVVVAGELVVLGAHGLLHVGVDHAVVALSDDKTIGSVGVLVVELKVLRGGLVVEVVAADLVEGGPGLEVIGSLNLPAGRMSGVAVPVGADVVAVDVLDLLVVEDDTIGGSNAARTGEVVGAVVVIEEVLGGVVGVIVQDITDDLEVEGGESVDVSLAETQGEVEGGAVVVAGALVDLDAEVVQATGEGTELAGENGGHDLGDGGAGGGEHVLGDVAAGHTDSADLLTVDVDDGTAADVEGDLDRGELVHELLVDVDGGGVVLGCAEGGGHGGRLGHGPVGDHRVAVVPVSRNLDVVVAVLPDVGAWLDDVAEVEGNILVALAVLQGALVNHVGVVDVDLDIAALPAVVGAVLEGENVGADGEAVVEPDALASEEVVSIVERLVALVVEAEAHLVTGGGTEEEEGGEHVLVLAGHHGNLDGGGVDLVQVVLGGEGEGGVEEGTHVLSANVTGGGIELEALGERGLDGVVSVDVVALNHGGELGGDKGLDVGGGHVEGRDDHLGGILDVEEDLGDVVDVVVDGVPGLVDGDSVVLVGLGEVGDVVALGLLAGVEADVGLVGEEGVDLSVVGAEDAPIVGVVGLAGATVDDAVLVDVLGAVAEVEVQIELVLAVQGHLDVRVDGEIGDAGEDAGADVVGDGGLEGSGGDVGVHEVLEVAVEVDVGAGVVVADHGDGEDVVAAGNEVAVVSGDGEPAEVVVGSGGDGGGGDGALGEVVAVELAAVEVDDEGVLVAEVEVEAVGGVEAVRVEVLSEEPDVAGGGDGGLRQHGPGGVNEGGLLPAGGHASLEDLEVVGVGVDGVGHVEGVGDVGLLHEADSGVSDVVGAGLVLDGEEAAGIPAVGAGVEQFEGEDAGGHAHGEDLVGVVGADGGLEDGLVHGVADGESLLVGAGLVVLDQTDGGVVGRGAGLDGDGDGEGAGDLVEEGVGGDGVGGSGGGDGGVEGQSAAGGVEGDAIGEGGLGGEVGEAGGGVVDLGVVADDQGEGALGVGEGGHRWLDANVSDLDLADRGLAGDGAGLEDELVLVEGDGVGGDGVLLLDLDGGEELVFLVVEQVPVVAVVGGVDGPGGGVAVGAGGGGSDGVVVHELAPTDWSGGAGHTFRWGRCR